MRVLLRTLLIAGIMLGASCSYYRFELRKQHLEPADVLVVPGFRLTEQGEAEQLLVNRVAMAKVLLDSGFAPRMIVSGGLPRNGVTEADRMLELAVAMGIPEHKIILEPKARSSVENARYSAEIAAAMGFESAIVVTDMAHLFYAVPVFRDAFEQHGLVLYWTPVDYLLLQRLAMAQLSDE